jgi:hypothetical protein
MNLLGCETTATMAQSFVLPAERPGPQRHYVFIWNI